MCIVSNVGDYWGKNIYPTYPKEPLWKWDISEVERLKRDIKALKILLKAAFDFDKETGQPECQHEDKIRLIRKMAEAAGVDISDVI
jgi:hypothetical protein